MEEKILAKFGVPNSKQINLCQTSSS